MRLADFVRLTLLALTLSFIGAPATFAAPSNLAAIAKADTASVQPVGGYGYYHRRRHSDCEDDTHYHSRYRSYSYSRDYYRPNRRYYGDNYSNYGSYYYSYRRPRYRSYEDYDYEAE